MDPGLPDSFLELGLLGIHLPFFGALPSGTDEERQKIVVVGVWFFVVRLVVLLWVEFVVDDGGIDGVDVERLVAAGGIL